MIETNKRIIKHKVILLNLAEALDNVSKTCKVMIYHAIRFIAIRRQWTAAGLKHRLTARDTNPI